MSEPPKHNDPFVVSTGVDGETGRSLLPPTTPEALGRLVADIPPDEELSQALQDWCEGKTVRDPFRAPSTDVKCPTDLADAGWGVIFAEDTPAGVRRALRPLLELRSDQAKENYFELTYEAQDTFRSFMSRVGFKPGTQPSPNKLPYYLLLVGDPEKMPFGFQRELDVQFAVGRLHFDAEDPEKPDVVFQAYRAYADAVVAAEEGKRRRRKTIFFSVENPGDEATGRVAGELVEELAGALQKSRREWSPEVIGGKDATKEQLRRLFQGDNRRPSFLFTSSHGLRFRNGKEEQARAQGALVCRDWDSSGAAPQRDHYFSAADVPEDADLTGLITFHFACYSAGTPQFDEFGELSGIRGEIAPHPFVARLPQKLLEKGALAVIGHIDRTWTSSFTWREEGGHVQVYNDILKQLMDGLPVGWAMEAMGAYHGSLAASLNEMRAMLPFHKPEDYAIYADLWRETNDARNFVVLGDPAVRLNLD